MTATVGTKILRIYNSQSAKFESIVKYLAGSKGQSSKTIGVIFIRGNVSKMYENTSFNCTNHPKSEGETIRGDTYQARGLSFHRAFALNCRKHGLEKRDKLVPVDWPDCRRSWVNNHLTRRTWSARLLNRARR